MPGRVSTRPSVAPSLPRKSSVPTLSSGASTHARPSTVNAIPEDSPVTALRTQICVIFADSQKSTAGHRKLIVNLRKIQERCAYEPPQTGSKGPDEFEEKDFNEEVMRCLCRVLAVKKTETAGDRVIRFAGQFLRHASEKDLALFPAEELEQAEVLPETPSSRLVSHILSTLLPLSAAKEKIVRYRATQIMAHIINSLDSIDDECYNTVKSGLLRRIRDKEPMVRVQAMLGLGRLAGNEGTGDEEDEMSDDESGKLLEKLLDVLQNDPSADVRRTLLLNLPLTPSTLPFLLERARDLDGATRRALYARLLPALGDFRHLSLSMREKLLRWGLRDRDETVRKATARLFRERWIGDCSGIRNEESDSQQRIPPSLDSLLELLERIDIINSGVESGVAHEAMHEFWEGRPDYLSQITMGPVFWDDLTAEKAFLARSLNDYCRQPSLNNRFDNILDEKLPEVTKLAFYIQRYTNALISQLQQLDPRQKSEPAEATVELEFVTEQLLHIALTVDYSDEIGRRQMFALLREMLALPDLPDEITKLMVEALRLICGPDAAGEREFCGLVLEAVAEVHDTIAPEPPLPMDDDGTSVADPDESFHSARSAQTSDTTPTKDEPKKLLAESTDAEDDDAKAIREILVNLKCLHITRCMLQNVHCELQPNIHLLSMLNNLVVPAVRSHEAPVREQGLLCLGLCCLLDRTLAEENLTLFLHCFSKGHPALQTTALEILSDMLTTHPTLLSPSTDAGASDTDRLALRKQIFKAFAKGLKLSSEPGVQAAAVHALCKLMLTRVIVDADLLRSVVILFFEPITRANAAARQALSYFLPTYAHSRAANQAALAVVVPAVIHGVMALSNADEAVDEDDDAVSWATVSSLLADWTDPRKLVQLEADRPTGWVAAEDDENRKKEDVCGDAHLIVAEGCLERALGNSCAKEEKKVHISMLSKLYVTSNSSRAKIASVLDLASEAVDLRVAADAPTRNSLTKYVTALEKAAAAADAAVPEKLMSPQKGAAGPRKSVANKTSDTTLAADVTDAAFLDTTEAESMIGEQTKLERDSREGTIVPDTTMATEEDSVVDALLEDD